MRAAAQAAVTVRIRPEYARAFIRGYPVVLALQRAQRVDHRRTVERINALLEAESLAILPEVLAAHSGDALRAIFKLLVESGQPGRVQQIVQAGMAAPDPVMRLVALRAASQALEPTALRHLLDTAQHDSFPAVRRAALESWVERLPEESGSKLAAALMDSSPGVRSLARFWLREGETVDFRSLYRSAVLREEPATLCGAIGGLGETGDAEDAEVLLALLSHPRPKVRAAAVSQVLRLGNERYVRHVLPIIGDPSRRVGRVAQRALQTHASRLDSEELLRIFRLDARLDVRLNALSLIAGLPKWEAIVALLPATVDPNPIVSVRARAYVSGWNAAYNRSQVPPSAEQLDRVEGAIALVEGVLPPTLMSSIREGARAAARRP